MASTSDSRKGDDSCCWRIKRRIADRRTRAINTAAIAMLEGAAAETVPPITSLDDDRTLMEAEVLIGEAMWSSNLVDQKRQVGSG